MDTRVGVLNGVVPLKRKEDRRLFCKKQKAAGCTSVFAIPSPQSNVLSIHADAPGRRFDGRVAARRATLLASRSLLPCQAPRNSQLLFQRCRRRYQWWEVLTRSHSGESQRSTVVLDTEQHPLAFSQVEDYLRTDASTFIEQRGAGGSQADISIRGTSFEQTLVLLNGLRIDDAETSHNNMDIPVPLGSMKTVDVLHGAGSTLYGSDAIGGVVDFVTAEPTANSLLLRAGGGNYGSNEQKRLPRQRARDGPRCCLVGVMLPPVLCMTAITAMKN